MSTALGKRLGIVCWAFMAGLIAAMPDPAAQTNRNSGRPDAPTGWKVQAGHDVWAARAPFENGKVFVEIRRFETSPEDAVPERLLAEAQSTVEDFDGEAGFTRPKLQHLSDISAHSAAELDARYSLDGMRLRSWIVALEGREPGVGFLWRYVAPESVFEDYVLDAAGVLKQALHAAKTKQNESARTGQPAAASPPDATKSVPPAGPDVVELAFWQSIAQSADPQEFEAYLRKYPNGAFSELARLRLAKLGERIEATGEPATPDTAAPVGQPVEAGLHDCDRLAADPRDPDAVAPGPDNDLGMIDNPEKALAACERAVADFPHEPRFLTQMGNAYLGFTDDRNDPQKAIELYRKAAELGSRHANYALGALAKDGMLAQDGRHHMEEAAMWFQKAAEQGHAGAMTGLALVLESGDGMAPDFEKAADYLLAAARAGDEGAMDALMIYSQSRQDGTLRAVQDRLFRAGLYHGKIDGKFGPASLDAFLSYIDQPQ